MTTDPDRKPSLLYGGRDEDFERYIRSYIGKISKEIAASRARDARPKVVTAAPPASAPVALVPPVVDTGTEETTTEGTAVPTPSGAASRLRPR